MRAPLGGIVVLGLGEHVDYWDRLGWKDPFSSAVFSRRQSEYQDQVFRTGSIYTPQLVVDGQFEAVGSDVQAVRRAVATAARTTKAAIDMAASPRMRLPSRPRQTANVVCSRRSRTDGGGRRFDPGPCDERRAARRKPLVGCSRIARSSVISRWSER